MKNYFGLDSFSLNSFYATEAALGFAVLAYILMSTFRQAVMRAKIQPILATLHRQVLAVGTFWNRESEQNQLLLAVSRRRRAWLEGLWANAASACGAGSGKNRLMGYLCLTRQVFTSLKGCGYETGPPIAIVVQEGLRRK